MAAKSQYELDREANIAKNRALFADLGLQDAISGLGISKPKNATAPKPVGSKPKKRPRDEPEVIPRRSSRRLQTQRNPVPDNETPAERRARLKAEQEEEERQEEARLAAEEQVRQAKRPRHDDLELIKLLGEDGLQTSDTLTATLKGVALQLEPSLPRDPDDIESIGEVKHQREVAELKKKFKDLKVISRAKVTLDRIYTAAYHPELTKDLIFFGDKYGRLGVWDARAPRDTDDDENDDPQTREGGKYWRLQPHWPPTSKSAISCIKIDPSNSHNLYTSAYDKTVRSLSFETGISREVFATDILISTIDMPPMGQEMWISDINGGVTHLDLREDKKKPRRYELSSHKIGSVNINPVNTNLLLTASNNRLIKVWDVRHLSKIHVLSGTDVELAVEHTEPKTIRNFSEETVLKYAGKHEGTLRAEATHGQSATSAYWDPRGRSIVSTCYDNNLRRTCQFFFRKYSSDFLHTKVWSLDSKTLDSSGPFPSFKPFSTIKHDCQTGRWLTLLRARWSPNPEAYPHFTIGNMRHSLDVYSHKGELIAALADPQRITAVQAVTCSHPQIIERAASGNASGRCVLWAPESEAVL